MAKSLEKSKSFDKLNSISINTRILKTDTISYNCSINNFIIPLKIGDTFECKEYISYKINKFGKFEEKYYDGYKITIVDIKQQLHTDNFYLLRFTIYFKEIDYTEDAVGYYDRFKNEFNIYETFHDDFQHINGDTSMLKLKHIENNLYVGTYESRKTYTFYSTEFEFISNT